MNEQHEREPSHSEEAPRPSPRIYVASLSDYNAGRLHGRWIEVDIDADIAGILEGINQVLMTSVEPDAEEWAIHDYDGFGMVRLSEYQSLETVLRLARGTNEHGPAFTAWAGHVGIDDAEALDGFEDAFLGTWDSLRDYAEGLLDDMGLSAELEKSIPDLLQGYVSVDVESFARDMELGGMVTVIEDPEGHGVWIFDGTA